MTDKEFLSIFDKIDEKYIDEAQKDIVKRRQNRSRRMFINSLSTAAACLALVISAALLVSSFISGYPHTLPSSPGAADSLSNDSSSSTSELPSEDSESTESYVRELTYNRCVSIKGELNFNALPYKEPLNRSTPAFWLDDDIQQMTQSIGAEIFLWVDGPPDADEEIPVRMYLFADGQQTLFRYDDKPTSSYDFTLRFNKETTVGFSFSASRYTNTIAVVCVLFPGDPEREDCVILTALNESRSEDYRYNISEMRDNDVDYFRLDIPDTSRPFITLGSDTRSVYEYTPSENGDLVARADAAPFVSVCCGSALTPLDGNYNDMRFDDTLYYYVIALVNGTPAPIFNGEFSIALVTYYDTAFEYRISEGYLSENDTVRIIAIPVTADESSGCAFVSDCYVIG